MTVKPFSTVEDDETDNNSLNLWLWRFTEPEDNREKKIQERSGVSEQTLREETFTILTLTRCSVNKAWVQKSAIFLLSLLSYGNEFHQVIMLYAL